MLEFQEGILESQSIHDLRSYLKALLQALKSHHEVRIFLRKNRHSYFEKEAFKELYKCTCYKKIKNGPIEHNSSNILMGQRLT